MFANSAFTLATSELGQTGLVLFLKVDSSTTTGTSQVLVTLLLSTFENKTKPVWPSSEVAIVNARDPNYLFCESVTIPSL